MSDKPALRDRRRTEARDALYRAMERRDLIIDNLVRNANHIKTLKRTLKRLNIADNIKVSSLRASVAEGKMLEPLEPVEIDTGIVHDNLPDWTGA